MEESSDCKEVVSRLSESLEQVSLTDPDPKTKELIRCFAREAKSSDRLDVVKHLREITPAGTTGDFIIGFTYSFCVEFLSLMKDTCCIYPNAPPPPPPNPLFHLH